MLAVAMRRRDPAGIRKVAWAASDCQDDGGRNGEEDEVVPDADSDEADRREERRRHEPAAERGSARTPRDEACGEELAEHRSRASSSSSSRRRRPSRERAQRGRTGAAKVPARPKRTRTQESEHEEERARRRPTARRTPRAGRGRSFFEAAAPECGTRCSRAGARVRGSMRPASGRTATRPAAASVVEAARGDARAPAPAVPASRSDTGTSGYRTQSLVADGVVEERERFRVGVWIREQRRVPDDRFHRSGVRRLVRSLKGREAADVKERHGGNETRRRRARTLPSHSHHQPAKRSAMRDDSSDLQDPAARDEEEEPGEGLAGRGPVRRG